MSETQSPKTLILSTLLHAEWISGQALAEAAGLSRTAIWKHIHALRQEGYEIQASSGQGYRLGQLPDRLGAAAVQAGLGTKILGRKVVSRTEVDSTQNLAKTLVEEGAPEGTVVIAESQNHGRGRRGRIWSSIPHGVAMSVVFKPDLPPEKAPQFPILAGVAVAKAISRIGAGTAGLKWPNDLLMQGKKVVGILAEMEAEMDRIHAIFLGIGINVNATSEDIPPELKPIASSLSIACGRDINRLQLVRAILDELERAYLEYLAQGFRPIRSAWKEHSVTLGRRVHIDQREGPLSGTAMDMDESGGLILATEAGKRITVTAGEIHLQPPKPQT